MYSLICTILLAAFTGLDWTYIVHDSPARIVVVAGSLCTILQLLKRFLPSVNGWVAVALNFVLSASGILAITRPDQIWTVATWQNVIVTSLAAAGIHGTTKLIRSQDEQSQNLLAQKATAVLIAFAIGMGMLALAPPADAQTPAPAPIQNLYAAGLSYNTGATPAIAGTGLYARLINGSGTYAFTAIDAVPNSMKPFTVNTNIGAGVAQKITTIKGIDIFAPTATGISFNGQNVGWQWNGGAIAVVPFKSYYIVPTVRFMKSSVGGSGYQPIMGVLFGWGDHAPAVN